MCFQRQVNRALDDEHRATVALLDRVEQVFSRAARAGQTHDADLARLAGTLAQHLEHELRRHFEFEERELFPRLVAAGDGDLVGLLDEEHAALRLVAAEVLPLARAAAAAALDGAGWRALHRGTQELGSCLAAHIQKETVALLPLLEDVLDEEADRVLAFDHASS